MIISPERWGHNFVSKHHYAELLSRENNVFFLQPGSQNNRADRKKNLALIDYKLPRGINRLPSLLNKGLYQYYVNKIIGMMDCLPDVVWSFDPYVFQNLSLFSANAFKIYHPVDVHRTHLDAIVAAEADIILGTSDLILDKFRGIDTPTYKINHGLASHFAQPNLKTLPLPKGTGRLKVGYVGNLNYKFLDYPTLLTILNSNPDLDFYFIGPDAASNLGNGSVSPFISEIRELPNTYMMGSKPSHDLPGYLKNFDCFLMCYKADQFPAEMANPHKILEYLSTGKVVISHNIYEYDNSGLVEMVKSNTELPNRFKDVVANIELYNSEEKAIGRMEFANENLYQNHLNTISALILQIWKFGK